jgi:putative transcription antitermination factor YqgF
MPGLLDEAFAKSVVYLCEHSERGALGLVINKLSDISLKHLFDKVELPLRRMDLADSPVFHGGPVQTERGFVLHEAVFSGDVNSTESVYASTMVIPGGLEMTTSKDVLEALSTGAGPRKVLVSLGYSAWGEGPAGGRAGRKQLAHRGSRPRCDLRHPGGAALRQGADAARAAGLDVVARGRPRMSDAAASDSAVPPICNPFWPSTTARNAPASPPATGSRAAPPASNTIQAEGDARFTPIAALVREWQPDALVVGVPYHPDGAPHENTRKAQRFARQLRGRFGLPVFEVDERYSTTEAIASGAKDADAASACIILEQFLRSLP